MKKISVILNLCIFLVNIIVYGQSNSDYKIGIKDYHSAAVSSVIATKDGNYFISGDENGKVLMFNTKTFEFVKTLRKASDIPISSLGLARQDSLLFISQRFEYGFNRKLDSLIAINLYNGEIKAMQVSVDFIESEVENLIIIRNHWTEPLKDLIEITNKDFSFSYKFIVENKHRSIRVSHDIKLAVFIEKENDNEEELKILDLKTNQIIRSIKTPDDLYVLSAFFDKETNDLLALTTNKKDTFSIYDLTHDDSWTAPVYGTSFYSNESSSVLINYIESQCILSVTNSNLYPSPPLVIAKNKNSFTPHVPALPDGAIKALFIAKEKKILFFKNFHEHSSNIASFTVYDHEDKTVKEEYFANSRKYYEGIFMSNGDWMVMGDQIKYFSNGTFQNRFDKLDLNDYLEVKAGIHVLPGPIFHLDKKTGVHVFIGYKGNSTEMQPSLFYKYNFMTDSVSNITTIQTDYSVIIDYNDANNILLLANDRYFNDGFTESVEFELIIDGEIIRLRGDYKFGELSNDGKYLLTISKNNLVEIKSISEDKTIFSLPLTDGSYTLFAVGDDDFIISNSFRSLDFNQCNKESIIIEIEDDLVKEKTLPCFIIDDLSYMGEKNGLIVENLGVIIDNDKIPFGQSEFPKAISFNTDASKMMLSLSNGKIVIYDTETLKELGTMIHPNKDTHIFYNVENYYFSNTPAEDYLYVTKNNIQVPLSSADKQLYRPDKILAMFGKPNQEYLKTLEKAMAIRFTKKDFSVEETVAKPKEENQIKTPSTDKPELYFLSIGISDYEQSNYNLTFADKDAMDMATIYGQLTNRDLIDYKTKFFGHHYSLYDAEGNVQLKMNKYLDDYERTSGLYALNPEATLWLEDGLDSYFIWNLEKQTVVPLVLPEDFTLSYNLYHPIFAVPDGSGFYFRDSNNTYYKYHFKEKSYKKIDLPFEVIDDQHQPIGSEEWLKFEEHSDSIKISIGKINSSKPSTLLGFPINTYKKLSVDGSYELITESYKYYSPNFKSATLNGKHLTYRVGSGELFYISLDEPDPLPILIPLEKKVEYSDEVTMNSNGKIICITEKQNEAYRFKSERFDLSGKKLKTLILKDTDYKIKGFTAYDANPKYIKEASPLVVNNSFFGEDKVMETAKPFAFEKVHVRYLINTTANSKEITKTLNNFFKNARPQDQAMIFLAGHGVLDDKYNYYFAPHDMDFKSISKNGIAFPTIIESLKTSLASSKFLLMDSCHSGNTLDLIEESDIIPSTVPKQGKRGATAISTNEEEFKVSDIVKSIFDDFLSKSGVTIISASTGGDLALEGVNPTLQPFYGNGAFTYSYIKALKEKIKGSSIFIDEEDTKREIPLTDGFITEIFKKVTLLTKGKQVPDLREINEKHNIKIW